MIMSLKKQLMLLEKRKIKNKLLIIHLRKFLLDKSRKMVKNNKYKII
jgi:hypothetical protein